MTALNAEIIAVDKNQKEVAKQYTTII